MKICWNCNSQVADDMQVCPCCGTPLTPQAPQVQPQYGYPQMQPQTVREDKTNVGLCILSVFIPLFGIIYYCIKRKEKPKEAKGCLISGLISAGVNILISIILSVILIGGTFKAIDNIGDNIQWSFGDGVSVIEDDYWNNFNIDTDEDSMPLTASNEAQSENSQQFPPDSERGNSTKLWDYQIKIGATDVQLPMSCADFISKTGFNFKSEDDANDTLKKNHFTVVTMKKDDASVHCTIVNTGDSLKPQKDCIITGISESKSSQHDSTAIFAGRFKAGQKATREEVENILGKADKDYVDGDDYVNLKWYEDYDTYYSQRSFEITIYKGVISDISIATTVQ